MRKISLPKITYLLLLTGFFQTNARSQQNFQSGYIVKPGSDTINGQINYRNREKNPKRIEFRRGTENETIFYTPAEITAFNVANENYVSAAVLVDKSPYKIRDLDYSPDFKLVADTFFLQVLVAGSKPLYYLKDNEGRVSFFIKGEQGYELLLYKEYRQQKDVSIMRAKNEGYKNQVYLYLRDCPTLRGKIEKMSYSLDSMLGLFREYYDCKGTNPVYQKAKDVNRSEFGFLAGLSRTGVTFKSEGPSYVVLVRSHFPASMAFAAGVFYTIYAPRNLNKISFTNELFYSSYKTEGVYETRTSPVSSEKTLSLVGYSYVKWNLMAGYTHPVHRISVYINAGMSNGLAINERNNKKEIETSFSTETVKEGKVLNDTQKYERGYLIGVGARYVHYSFEARFENGNGMTGNKGPDASVKRYYFLLGYRF